MNSYLRDGEDLNLALNCPYHPHWVRLGLYSALYRSCPVCRYCIRCQTLNRALYPALDRPIRSRHTHGAYQFTEAELERVTA